MLHRRFGACGVWKSILKAAHARLPLQGPNTRQCQRPPPLPPAPRLPAGIEVYTCTLDSNFKLPFLREYILLLGLRSVARRSLQYILTR